MKICRGGSFTFLLFTFNHIHSLLRLHVAEESSLEVVVVVLGGRSGCRGGDACIALGRDAYHAIALCEVYLYVVGAWLAREEPCAGKYIRCHDGYVLVKIGRVAVGVGSETCGVDKVPVGAETLKHGEVEIAHFAHDVISPL